MIKFACSNCGHRIGAPDKYAGKRVRCPKCKGATQVPQAGGAAAAGTPSERVIKFRCPECNQKIGVSRDYAGKRVRCAKCKSPMRVPGGAQAPSRPAAQDAKAVLKAGHEEQPPADPDIWGDMGDINELLAAEQSAPALEREAEPGGPDIDDDERAYPQYAQRAPSAAGYGPGGAGGEPKKSRKTIIIVAACVIGVLVLGIAAWFLAGPGPGQAGGTMDAVGAQRIAEEYIVLVEDGQVENATRLLAEELRGDDYKDDIEAFSKQIGKNNMTELECTTTHFEEGLEGVEFYFWYKLHYEPGEQAKQSVVVNVRGADGDFAITGVGAEDIYGQTASIGPKSFEELFDKLITAEAKEFGWLFGKFFCGFLLIALVLVVVQVISMWVLFEKAGQPGWAAIVPFYNMWVFAEVGDKPGWWGLAAIFSAGIPVIGSVIQFVLFLTISIGVAQAFGRGVIFGIGLAILPFIFLPILAFSSD